MTSESTNRWLTGNLLSYGPTASLVDVRTQLLFKRMFLIILRMLFLYFSPGFLSLRTIIAFFVIKHGRPYKIITVLPRIFGSKNIHAPSAVLFPIVVFNIAAYTSIGKFRLVMCKSLFFSANLCLRIFKY